MLRTIAGWLVAGMSLLVAAEARAEIIKCRSASGEISYTQTTCPEGSEPINLPEDMSRRTGSSFKSSLEPTTLSPRAMELQKLPRKEREALNKRCMVPLNWNEDDCLVLRELTASERSRRELRADTTIERQRQRCEAGIRSACAPVNCGSYVRLVNGNSPYIPYQGSDSDIRACSRVLSLPSTERWAQIGTSEPGEEFAVKLICLPRINMPDGRGEIAGWRGALVVFRSLGNGDAASAGFQTPALGKQVFGSIDEAADAGCTELLDFSKQAKPRRGI